MYKAWDLMLEEIKRASSNGSVIVAIDGRCAAGKTTFAAHLKKLLDCNVIHMDDFFLQPQQRTEQRLSQPGGNVDYERFLAEVLIPLKRGEAFCFSPYDCHEQKLMTPIHVEPKPVTIVEGSYSCHKALWNYYDLQVFLTIDPSEQKRRILERNGSERLQMFLTKWIPLEEKYFEACKIMQKCKLYFSTDEWTLQPELFR